ncbi:MAG: tyrosine-type recombinase/integrase [Lachnospiraceae bacterium]|nr:tyrosine-type recombinase/integrase [Lachnospiraceae bacterium]
MGRRGENIRKRSDGRWEARVICGPPKNGKTNYKYLYGHSYHEVKTLKKEFLLNLSSLPEPIETASVNSKPPEPPQTALVNLISAELPTENDRLTTSETSEAEESSPLFRTVAYEWLATKKLSVKESTYATYLFMVEKHLFPDMGDLGIKKVDTDRIGAFLLDKKEHGGLRGGNALSDKTVSEIKGTLNRVLRYAKSHNIIDSVPDSMPVSVKQPPIEVLTKQEQKTLEAKASEEDTAFSLGVLLCLNTGVREGELCGLQWADFNWADETISISRTVSRISNTDPESDTKTRVVIGKPKTVCSIRTIPIPTNIVSYIKERAGTEADYVLTGTEKYMEPRVCRDRFSRLEKRAGVKHHNFHILRHTYATNCVADGVNIKVLSENLGHSDINITLQRYVHPSMESKKAEVNKLTTFMDRNQ